MGLECCPLSSRGVVCCRGIILVFVYVLAVLLRSDLLCDIVQAFAGPDVAHETRNILLWPVEDGLYERLECAVLRLQSVGILLVYAFTTMVCPWRVDTFGIVDLSAGGATRLVPVAFAFALAELTVRSVATGW